MEGDLFWPLILTPESDGFTYGILMTLPLIFVFLMRLLDAKLCVCNSPVTYPSFDRTCLMLKSRDYLVLVSSIC